MSVAAMIVVDTNVISELMRPLPSPALMAWLSGKDSAGLYLTGVSEGELRAGAAILPEGLRIPKMSSSDSDMPQRGVRLTDAIDAVVRQDFARRVLPFDSAAARSYAAIAASRRSLGRPIPDADCQIAAIARARDAALATRNAEDFAHCGIAVINPWAASAGS